MEVLEPHTLSPQWRTVEEGPDGLDGERLVGPYTERGRPFDGRNYFSTNWECQNKEMNSEFCLNSTTRGEKKGDV